MSLGAGQCQEHPRSTPGVEIAAITRAESMEGTGVHITRIPRYSPALDGLRALSVAAVLLMHGGYGHFNGGWIGVEVFFALSGYLITRLLLEGFSRSGHIDFLSFYWRRARRLLPAFALSLGLAAILWPWANASVPFLPPALAGLAYYANWRVVFLGTTSMGAMTHLWSLSVEEQFYLIWPAGLALMLARDRSLRLATAVTVGLILSAATARSVLRATHSPLAQYPSTLTHIDVLLVGAVFALLQAQTSPAAARNFWQRTSALTPAWLALGILACLATFLEASTPALYRYGGFTLLGLLAMTIVMHVVNAPESRLARLLGLKVLTAVGKRSYGIYLYHFPIFLALEKLQCHTAWLA